MAVRLKVHCQSVIKNDLNTVMNQPQPNDTERQIIIVSSASNHHLPAVDYQETVAPLQDEEVHLRDYIDVLVRRKWVVILTLLFIFSATTLYTLTSTPLFQGKGTLKASASQGQLTSFADTGFPWVFPSPNMPSPLTALVYPGQVLWEGTNISEGRGTTLPFELTGAPFLDPAQILSTLSHLDLPGCVLRPLVFEPTSGKWAGQTCAGFHLHVADPHAFRSYRLSLALFQALFRLYPGEFSYKQPPYEYEYDLLPMDLIFGDQKIRKALEAGTNIIELERSWQNELKTFDDLRRSVFLYPAS
ncbi:MAG: DUF1343 domain-containing protein [Candidatus Electrothrix sp. ATG2]|nr:DUF1343 domain-containing protein [Candidatus Electrothrix sp. ATG2]